MQSVFYSERRLSRWNEVCVYGLPALYKDKCTSVTHGRGRTRRAVICTAVCVGAHKREGWEALLVGVC